MNVRRDLAAVAQVQVSGFPSFFVGTCQYARRHVQECYNIQFFALFFSPYRELLVWEGNGKVDNLHVLKAYVGSRL
jgi:hypothetical protein